MIIQYQSQMTINRNVSVSYILSDISFYRYFHYRIATLASLSFKYIYYLPQERKPAKWEKLEMYLERKMWSGMEKERERSDYTSKSLLEYIYIYIIFQTNRFYKKIAAKEWAQDLY